MKLTSNDLICGIKANLQTQTTEIIENRLHTDIKVNIATKYTI